MIFKLLISFLLCTSIAFAFDKDLKIENDRVPTEFSLLFDSMKLEIKTDKEKVRFVGLIQEMGDNLASLEKDQVFLLLKSEVIKNLLQYRFDKVREFDMTSLLIERLDNSYNQKQRYLSPFAQWIWRSTIAELKYRQKMGIITTKSFNPKSFEGAKKAEALRFERYLNYILPWIDRMDSLTASQFNELTKDVSWIILKRINERSILFKRYASTLASDTTVKLFNIPQRLLDIHPEDLKRIQANDPEEPTLKEKSEKAKGAAQESVDKITPDDMSPVSDEVMRTIDQAITPPATTP